MKKLVNIGITIGDINGVGPEVALRAAYRHRWPAHSRIVLIGSRKVLAAYAQELDLPTPGTWQPGEKATRSRVSIWDVPTDARLSLKPGRVSAPASRAAAHWIEAAAQAAMKRELDAIVTAPICKEGLQKAGLTIPGHTEFLAKLTRTSSFAMMLLNDKLRVVTLTRHIPVKRVANSITKAEIIRTAQLTSEALRLLGVRKKTIAICGLNPHAGDGGAIGREEITTIAPAIRQLQASGIAAEGPVPADTVFYQALQDRYGCVMSMYHDQGLAPFKMVAFDDGVNFTLGLPIIRTSPDHGTAFDIAGSGKADPSSMIAATKLALHLARRKNPWARKR